MVGRFKGQLPVFFAGSDDGDRDVSDYRPVPDSDRGNDGYNDQGMLGNFEAHDDTPRMPPAETKFFGGFGASDEDLKRGFCKPRITEHPAYDKVNYSSRASQPRAADEDFGNTNAMPNDWEFQTRNNRSKGFLTRKRLPTERG